MLFCKLTSLRLLRLILQCLLPSSPEITALSVFQPFTRGKPLDSRLPNFNRLDQFMCVQNSVSARQSVRISFFNPSFLPRLRHCSVWRGRSPPQTPPLYGTLVPRVPRERGTSPLVQSLLEEGGGPAAPRPPAIRSTS